MPNCRKCGSSNVKKNGVKRCDVGGGWTLVNIVGQFYRCKECGARFLVKMWSDGTEWGTELKDKNIEELFTPKELLGFNGNCNIEEVISNNEKTVTFTGFKVPESEKEVIEHYKIDLDVWLIDKIKFNMWGNEDNQNKQSTVILKKIVPDNPKCPPLKNLVMPKIYHKSKPYTAIKSIKKTMVACDSQIGFRRNLLSNKLEPFHDREAIDLFINLYDYIKPDELVLAGDMLDISEASQKFIKEPEFYFTTQSALIEFGYVLQKLRNINPDCKITYMVGNHEERLRKFALENMAFAYTLKQPKTDMSILSLKNLLDLASLNIDFIEDYPSGEYWINDKLRVVHGEYTKATTELNNSKISTIMGHLHKVYKEFKTSHGRDGIEKMFVETVGSLCKIDGTVPGQSQPNWQQSILLSETVNDKYFNTEQIVFHSGKTIYNGILFSGEDYTTEIEKYFKQLL